MFSQFPDHFLTNERQSLMRIRNTQFMSIWAILKWCINNDNKNEFSWIQLRFESILNVWIEGSRLYAHPGLCIAIKIEKSHTDKRFYLQIKAAAFESWALGWCTAAVIEGCVMAAKAARFCIFIGGMRPATAAVSGWAFSPVANKIHGNSNIEICKKTKKHSSRREIDMHSTDCIY